MNMSYMNWREYQNEAAAYFRRQGCSAEVDASVKGLRAQHKVDVVVNFLRAGIDCKLWNTRVPKEKVEALRSIVEDVGADREIIISEKGF